MCVCVLQLCCRRPFIEFTNDRVKVDQHWLKGIHSNDHMMGFLAIYLSMCRDSARNLVGDVE